MTASGSEAQAGGSRVTGGAGPRTGRKAARQARILQLVTAQRIETQEDLAAALEREGYAVTQATVSRDIRELGLVKLPAAHGRSGYAAPGAPPAWGALSERMLRLFRDCVLAVDWTEALVVLSTLPATAMGVAEVIDGMGAAEVIGTLAGERTVFVAIKPKAAVPTVVARLRDLLGPGSQD